MKVYESLIIEAKELDIIEKRFKSNAKGLCKGTRIGISIDIKTDAEKACVLAEELGHYYTTVGNILDQNDIKNCKQELTARAWAYQKLVPIHKIVDAHNAGVTSFHELSEYLGVTEEFLRNAIAYYNGKYGISVRIRNYQISFDPLSVIYIF